MKALRIAAYEASPTVEESEAPPTGPGQVLVRVHAAALNPLDVKMQVGAMRDFFPIVFPHTLGTDFAGTIEQVGPGAEDWSVGDRIVCRTDPPTGGALAELAAVDAGLLARWPTGLADEEAAGVPTTAGTAWQALVETGELRAGQSVLVHAGAGGVGSFAVQIARNIGAHVIATASGEGLDIARRLGADQVIDHRAGSFADQISDLDLVLDTIGGDTQTRSFDVLRKGGRLLSTVAPPSEVIAKAHDVHAAFIIHQSDAARLTKLLELVAKGELQVLIDRRSTLDAVAAAFAYQASGRAHGKVIIKPENRP